MRKMRFFSILLILAFAFAADAFAADYLLLKGDLHCHTNFSPDCQVPPDQVIADSIAAGYDFISFTDHNSKYQLRKDYSTPELVVLPGYEMTLSGGHYNVFGIRDFLVRGSLIREELGEYMAYLRGLGAFIQLNHPNDAKYGSKYGYDFNFELLEVLNGRPTADDYKTIADYQTLLCSGRKIVAIANSDAHKNHSVRYDFNWVLSTAKSSEAIMEAIKAGRSFLTTSVSGPVISMNCGDAVMGATVPRAAGQTVDIAISGMPEGANVKVYTSAGLLSDSKAEDGSFKASVPASDYKFVRCEVWLNGVIAALSNPIYID